MNRIIWLVRHGNRLDFVYPEWFEWAQRRYDPPLSEDGFIQAEKLATRLGQEKIDHIFCSPFLRTIQMAHRVAQTFNLPLKIEAGLGEWLNADWMTEYPQTHPQELLAGEYPQIDWGYQSYLIPEYPESEAQVKERCGQTTRQLVTLFSGNLLLVGHSISVGEGTRGLVGKELELELGLGSLVKVVESAGQWQLELGGDTSYLGT